MALTGKDYLRANQAVMEQKRLMGERHEKGKGIRGRWFRIREDLGVMPEQGEFKSLWITPYKDLTLRQKKWHLFYCIYSDCVSAPNDGEEDLRCIFSHVDEIYELSREPIPRFEVYYDNLKRFSDSLSGLAPDEEPRPDSAT